MIDARNFKADVRLKKLRGQYIDPRDAKTPFEDWAERYLEEKLRLRPRTREKFEGRTRGIPLMTTSWDFARLPCSEALFSRHPFTPRYARIRVAC